MTDDRTNIYLSMSLAHGEQVGDWLLLVLVLGLGVGLLEYLCHRVGIASIAGIDSLSKECRRLLLLLGKYVILLLLLPEGVALLSE